MAQWSRELGARQRWHKIEKVVPRPDQANNLIVTVCGAKFPEQQSQLTPPDGSILCPKCSS